MDGAAQSALVGTSDRLPGRAVAGESARRQPLSVRTTGIFLRGSGFDGRNTRLQPDRLAARHVGEDRKGAGRSEVIADAEDGEVDVVLALDGGGAVKEWPRVIEFPF